MPTLIIKGKSQKVMTIGSQPLTAQKICETLNMASKPYTVVRI